MKRPDTFRAFRFLCELLFFCMTIFTLSADPGTVRLTAELTDVSTDIPGTPLLTVFSNERCVFLRHGDRVRPGESFSFDYTPGDELRIRYEVSVRKFFLTRRIPLCERFSSTVFAPSELLDSPIGTDAARLRFRLRHDEGRYKVYLRRSFIAPDDLERIGAAMDESVKTTLFDLARLLLLEEKNGQENTPLVSAMLDKLKLHTRTIVETIDPVIIVRHNGVEMLNTEKRAKPKKGFFVNWSDTEFEIDWKRGDSIDILFYDRNRVLKDAPIFRKRSDTTSGIDMLRGVLTGGESGKSFLVFSAKRLSGN